MEELARHHLIKPVVTQGHIGDVLPDKTVYDARTTPGGPLLDDQGPIIGINFTMVRDFGGSNSAIPVRFGESPPKTYNQTRFLYPFTSEAIYNKPEKESLTCLI
jgi:hypothetical protein